MSKSTPDPVDDLIVIVQRMRKVAQEWVSPPKVTMPEPKDAAQEPTGRKLGNLTYQMVLARYQMGLSTDDDVAWLLSLFSKIRNMPISERDGDFLYHQGATDQLEAVRDILDGRER